MKITPLERYDDDRGTYIIPFRDDLETELKPTQWNHVVSHKGVLRGPHFHLAHVDYIVVTQGQMTLGLQDIRRGSPTEGLSATLVLRAEKPLGVTIPPGVLHGFYFHEESLYLQGVSRYWDRADEMRVHWSDPALRIKWPTESPTLSDLDQQAPFLSGLKVDLPTWQAA